MKHFIFQGNNHDCGFASLKMLLADLANDDSYLNISKPDKKEKYTLTELEDIADSFNVKLESSSCDQSYYDKLKSPFLTMIDSNHVVLVKKKTNHFIILYDPARGKRILSKKNFFKIWDQVITEVVDAKNIQKIKKIKREILPKKLRITQAIISFTSVLLLLIGFYFLNDVSNFWFSFAFLLLFLLTQFLESFILFKTINYFDETYIPLYFSNEKSNGKNKYEEFLNFKHNYFVTNRSLLSSVLLSFVVVFLMCFNDFKNVLVLLILILLKLLEVVLGQKRTKNIYKKVDKYEQKGLENLTNNQAYLLKANQYANKKVFVDSVKNLIYMVLCFALAIYMMFITGNSGCNYVIFHFTLYFVAYKSFTDVLMGFSNNKKSKQEESKFFDACNL